MARAADGLPAPSAPLEFRPAVPFSCHILRILHLIACQSLQAPWQFAPPLSPQTAERIRHPRALVLVAPRDANPALSYRQSRVTTTTKTPPPQGGDNAA